MYKTIEMPDFYQKTRNESLAIIDVREAAEYARGHVPNAVNNPLSELDQLPSELDQQTEYYLICRSGARSANACEILDQQGYQVINVSGGTLDWPGILDY